MIRINLLPAEYRRVEGHPPGRLAVIFINLVLIGFALSAFLLIVLVRHPEAREERNRAYEEKGEMLRAIEVREKARARRGQVAGQLAALDQLLARRRAWSGALDQLGTAIGAQPAWLGGVRSTLEDGTPRLHAEVWLSGLDPAAGRDVREALSRGGWTIDRDLGLFPADRELPRDGQGRAYPRAHLRLPLVLEMPR